MAKQSNAFQKAIFYIHEQLKDTKATVRESAELCETNIETKVPREIDVLIEKELKNRIYRIAIECRDRGNKDDIEWVDSLIGKYKNLPVNQVIAVFNSGFSKNAVLKAEQNKIELKYTKDLKNIDWKKEYTALGFCNFSVKFDIKKLFVTTSEGIKKQVLPATPIFSGENACTFDEFVKFLNESEWPKSLKQRFTESIPGLYKTRADINKLAVVEHTISVSNFQIEFDGIKHELVSVSIVLLAIPSVEEVLPTVRKYEDSLITSAVVTIEGMKKQFVVYAAQAKKNDKQINVSIDKKKLSKKKSAPKK